MASGRWLVRSGEPVSWGSFERPKNLEIQ
jgi:hypothetical protein